MSKAVLISIRPEWVRKILNGSKTVEIRKTAPKCGVPFKCYIYCTAGGKVALKAKSKPVTRPPQSWRYVEEELWND